MCCATAAKYSMHEGIASVSRSIQSVFSLYYRFYHLVIKATAYSPSQAIVSCECVAFRLDDVQDFFLNKAQMAVMDTFSRHNASLALGIIGSHFGEDDALVEYINNSLPTTINSIDSQPAIFDITNHGWEHEDFTKYNATVQSSL